MFRHIYPKEDSERALMNDVKSVCLSNQAACKIQEQDWKLAKVCCESALDLDEKAVKVRLVIILAYLWYNLNYPSYHISPFGKTTSISF